MRRRIQITILTLLTAWPTLCGAQSYLNKPVSVKAKQKKLEEVLDIIGKQGGFYFSYSSSVVRADSLVDVDIKNKTVRQSLDVLFKNRFEYKETPNHVIIQYPSAGQWWYVSGYITDETTSMPVRDVTVFDSEQLVSALTNEHGYFKLKLKDKTPSQTIQVRNSLYRDTQINIKPGVDQEVRVVLVSRQIELDAVIVSGSDRVEGTWFGKAFLSSRQRIQSLNLDKFFVNMPVQGSVLPGLSSQGKMSAQVVNHFSFNMLGGYTAGVKGMEIAGLFNINKKDVSYMQVGGVINMVGGSVGGCQVAGVHNNVLNNVDGAQVGGVSNMVRGTVDGVQVSGVYNHAIKEVTGGQIAGAVNYANDTLTGIQLSGAANIARKSVDGGQVTGAVNFAKEDMDGVQISGGVNIGLKKVDGFQLTGGINYARNLDGVQIGLVNIADSSSGVSIGLFSFVRRGYHKVSLSANEAMPVNVVVKSGTRNLYNIYTVGAAFAGSDKAFFMGLGYGSELKLSKRFSLNPEIIGGMVYLGSWAEANPLIKLNLNANFRINKYISIFAGPTYNMYWDNKMPKVEGYKASLLPQGYKTTTYGTNLGSWVGWNVGVTIF